MKTILLLYLVLILQFPENAIADNPKLRISIQLSSYEVNENNGNTGGQILHIKPSLKVDSGFMSSDEWKKWLLNGYVTLKVIPQISNANDSDYTLLSNKLNLIDLVNNIESIENLSFHIQILNDTKSEADERIVMKLELSSTCCENVVIENPKELIITIKDSNTPFNKGYPFRLCIGTNFDLLDGVKTKDVYGEIYTFQPNVFNLNSKFSSRYERKKIRFYNKIFERSGITASSDRNEIAHEFDKTGNINELKRAILIKNNSANFDHEFFKQLKFIQVKNENRFKNKYGVYGGLYNNRTITDKSSNGINNKLEKFTLISSDTATVNLQRDSIQQKFNLQNDNIGFYGGIMYNLTLNSPNEKFQMFVGFHIETINRSFKFSYSNEIFRTDTINNIPLDSLIFYQNDAKINTPQNIIKRQDTYFGLSIPMKLQTEKADLVVIPSVGLWPHFVYDEVGLLNKRKYSLYYGLKFMLIENDFGLTLGADIHSIHKPTNNFFKRTGYPQISMPFINITLSKTFDLTHLKDYIKL